MYVLGWVVKLYHNFLCLPHVLQRSKKLSIEVRALLQRNMQVASELWQPCSRRTSQKSRIRWKGAISRNQEKKKVQKGYWISYTVGLNVSLCSHCGNTIEVPQFSSVQLFSCVRLFETPCSAARQASLSITNSQNLLKLMSIKLVMLSNNLILCYPLLLLPSVFLSIGVFSNESVLRIRWPKYWSFSFSISPSNKCSGLISFRTDWLDLLAVQGTLKSKSSPSPQFKSINSLVISFLYGPTLTSIMTTGKTIALTRQTFVGKVMSLFFNMLSSFFIAFLPRSKRLLVSWLQSPSAVILEPPKIKSITASIASPSICHEVMVLDAMIFVFWMLSFKPEVPHKPKTRFVVWSSSLTPGHISAQNCNSKR